MSSFLIQGLLFAVAFSWAGSYTAFMLDDFGGAETDSLQVDTGLSTGLRVGVETSLFLKVLDTALNDATTESGSYENYGANPLVVATEDGSFRALYLHYYNVSGGPDPSANHHYLWSVDLLNKTLSNQITAGTNNFHYKDVYADIYASGDKPNPVPVFAHFEANSSRWLALWSNDTVKSGPVVYSTWNDPYPTGATYFHFLKWPSGAYLRGTVLDFNYLRVAFAALDDRMEDVVCIHGPSRTQTTYGNTAKIFVRWERPTDTSIYAIDSQAVSSGTSSAHVGLYHVAVAVDSDKRVLAGWTNYSAQTLYLQAYDSSYSSGTITRLGSLTSFPSTLDTGLTTMDTLYRNFAIQNLQEDLFLVAYARSNQICYRMVDISGGAPSVSSETVVSLAGERCRFPDIAVNQNWVAFSFFRDTTDGKIPEAVVFRRSGTTLTDSMVVSYGRVTFNTLADGYATPMSTTSNSRYQHVRHLSQPGRVAVALDSAGALLLGFNQERNARLAGYRNCDVYFDTATWFSQALDLRGDSVDYTMESGDSVRFLSTSLSGTSTTYAQLLLSRNDTLVATPGSTAYEASATWRYRIQMARVDSFTTPEVTSAQIVWNLQPRKPQITGVRVGTSQSSLQSFSETTRYDVVNRRDSVWVFFSAWDLDNPADLTLHVRTSYVSPRNGVAQSFSFSQDVSGLTRTGDGSFSGTLLISPQDLLADSLVLSFSAQDSLWEGDARPLLLRYLNKLPSDALRILWKDGQGGSLDSAVTTGAVVRVQMDDSALVKVSASDSNDASLTVSWTISGLSGSNQSGSTTLSLTDTARIWIPWDLYDRNPANLPEGDSLELTPDTLTLSIQDPDTTLSQMLRFLPNHKPRLDSVSAVGFYQDGEYRDTLVGRWRHGDDPSYLTVPPGVPVRLIRHVREVDRVNGDSFSGVWQVLLQDTTDKTLWQIDTSATGDTLLYSFPSNPETQLAMLRLVETDLSGTMTEDTMNIVFPRVDTSGGWEVSLTYLQDSLRFILASSKTSANQEVGIRNIGSLSLQVLSVRTGNDDGDWLDYQILANSLSVVQDNTDVSRITTPITVAAGEELPVRLSFDVSSMSGDQTVHDTLYLTTSDFLTPSLKVPFTVRWDDLPSVQVFSQLQDDTSRVALTPYFAVNSSLVFAFSEPVRTASLPSYLKIYSRLDSIARGVNGITTLESAYSTVYSLRLAKRTGVTLTGMADTAIFTPYYTTVSDSIGAKPPPGYFLRGDQLGIWFSNSIVDSAGNPLDLQGKHVLTTAGTLDTTLVVATDTSTLRVLETWPKEGELYDPDEDIRILFSKPLSTTMVLDGDTTLALDLSTLDGDSNTTVQMRSRYGNNLLSDFRYLKLDRGDSLLVLRPKYKFLSSDSVQVWLSPSIASSQGHTLDGDSNGITSWPVVDTVDSYSFRFVVGATDFYAFPNPFKFSNAEHREKGCISFKNLHQIKGVNLEKEIEIRIYSVDGNLVYSTKRKKNSFLYSAEGAQAPQFDWYLRNNHDRPVASGTYLYTISQSGKVLKKSKLMIIR